MIPVLSQQRPTHSWTCLGNLLTPWSCPVHVLATPDLVMLATCQSKRIICEPLSPSENLSENPPLSGLPPLEPPTETEPNEVPPLPPQTQYSSDSSDDYIILPKWPTKMSEYKFATVFHPILSCTLMLTKGEITLKVVQEFKSHCAHYFINMKDGVPNDAKVTKILGCFEESVIND